MSAPSQKGWLRLDAFPFGLRYAAVMVLGILVAAGAHPDTPFNTAAVLIGCVLAIPLAKTFAEPVSNARATGERMRRAAMHHRSPAVAVANVPAWLFLAALARGIGVDPPLLKAAIH